MRHYSAYYKSKLSVPIPLANLKLWLKADAGITLNGSNVSVWADQSGNGNNATQSNAINQPLFVADGGVDVNNKPILRFDGSNDFMYFNDISLTNATIFVIFKHIVDDVPLLANTTLPVDLIQINRTNSLYSVWYLSFSTNGHDWAFGDYPISSDYHLLTISQNGKNTAAYLDAIALALSLGDGQPVTPTFNNIGYSSWSPKKYFKGDISEIIIYTSALSTSERQQVENYLMTKYGL